MYEVPEKYKRPSVDILSIRNDYRKRSGGKFITIRRDKEKNLFYKNLKDNNPELKVYTNSQIRKYIMEFNKRVKDTVLVNREGVDLPSHMGPIFIATYGKRKYGVDKNLSRMYKKKIYFTHEKVNRQGGCIFWVPKLEKYKFPNSHLWRLEPCQIWKKELMESYLSRQWKKYITVPSKRYVYKYIAVTYNKTKIQAEQAITRDIERSVKEEGKILPLSKRKFKKPKKK